MFIDMYMSDDNKPIGWWLKELDRLLEASFEQVLAADGLTRRQWQALNAAAGPEPIAVALAPFLTGDPGELSAAVDPLTARGWLADEATRRPPARRRWTRSERRSRPSVSGSRRASPGRSTSRRSPYSGGWRTNLKGLRCVTAQARRSHSGAGHLGELARGEVSRATRCPTAQDTPRLARGVGQGWLERLGGGDDRDSAAKPSRVGRAVRSGAEECSGPHLGFVRD